MFLLCSSPYIFMAKGFYSKMIMSKKQAEVMPLDTLIEHFVYQETGPTAIYSIKLPSMIVTFIYTDV